MTTFAVDIMTRKILTREAEQLRAQRMDKPALEVIQFARQEAERDMLVSLMSKEPGQ